MPITNQVTKSSQISTIMFKDDGTISISMSSTIDGVFQEDTNFNIDAITVSSFLDVPCPAGLTVREYIISTIYTYLNTTGNVTGTISYQ